jgi:hypothetical protein
MRSLFRFLPNVADLLRTDFQVFSYPIVPFPFIVKRWYNEDFVDPFTYKPHRVIEYVLKDGKIKNTLYDRFDVSLLENIKAYPQDFQSIVFKENGHPFVDVKHLSTIERRDLIHKLLNENKK